MNILLSPLSDPGYLYPAVAVGLELRRRGHTVHLLGRPSATGTAAAAGLDTVAAADCGAPLAFSAGRWFREGEGQYLATLRAAAAVRADAVVTSVLCHGALVAAEVLDIPVVVLGLAAHLWTYRPGPLPSADGTRAEREALFLSRLQQIRDTAGLRPRADQRGAEPLFGTALLVRGASDLEEPGALLPDRVHQVGPCFWEPEAPSADLDAVDGALRAVGKPVVYVHLGRYFGGTGLWPTLADAFTGGRFQAVVELGRTPDPDPGAVPLRGADVVQVRKPWMTPLIERSELVLTNATSAPVLGALLRGRPLAVAPEGSEQPLLARACVRAGVAARLPAGARARQTLARISADDGLHARARRLGAELAATDGPARAADLVTLAVTGRPERGRKENADV